MLYKLTCYARVPVRVGLAPAGRVMITTSACACSEAGRAPVRPCGIFQNIIDVRASIYLNVKGQYRKILLTRQVLGCLGAHEFCCKTMFFLPIF